MEDHMIELEGITKRFGATHAVEGVSFTAPAGKVTAFLGPNGAGKTTTIRVLLGLARPDAGSVRINGTTYDELSSPRREVGAVLDAIGFHPGRTARHHLQVLALAAGIDGRRVDQVLELVDLQAAAGRKVGGFSLGMRQRLALAGALLGDPKVLVLDEPANGLDPAGMAWLRGLITGWAEQGRTVLVSSHVLTEVALVADRFVIIDRGKVVREADAAGLGIGSNVQVRTAHVARLGELATARGWVVDVVGPDRLTIAGATLAEVGDLAAGATIALSELSATSPTMQLEGVFLQLTGSLEEVAS
jgi:ABC-2 type transport system ATP-binding protein